MCINSYSKLSSYSQYKQIIPKKNNSLIDNLSRTHSPSLTQLFTAPLTLKEAASNLNALHENDLEGRIDIKRRCHRASTALFHATVTIGTKVAAFLSSLPMLQHIPRLISFPIMAILTIAVLPIIGIILIGLEAYNEYHSLERIKDFEKKLNSALESGTNVIKFLDDNYFHLDTDELDEITTYMKKFKNLSEYQYKQKFEGYKKELILIKQCNLSRRLGPRFTHYLSLVIQQEENKRSPDPEILRNLEIELIDQIEDKKTVHISGIVALIFTAASLFTGFAIVPLVAALVVIGIATFLSYIRHTQSLEFM